MKFAIGIDIGGSHIRIALIQDEDIILKKNIYINNINILSEKESISFLEENILNNIKDILKEKEIPIENILKIGIAVPGIIDDGVVKNIVNLNIKKWKILVFLKKHFPNIKIKIENDSLSAIKAEKKYGNLKNEKEAIFIAIGTGIGAKLIINDKVIEKNIELGHMLFEYNGIECKCGKKGCFEKYCSYKDFREKLQTHKKEELIDLLKNLEGNPNKEYILKIVDEFARKLAYGIISISEIFDIDTFVIGGGLSELQDTIVFEKIKEYINMIPKVEKDKKINIKAAFLKNDAQVIGSII